MVQTENLNGNQRENQKNEEKERYAENLFRLAQKPAWELKACKRNSLMSGCGEYGAQRSHIWDVTCTVPRHRRISRRLKERGLYER